MLISCILKQRGYFDGISCFILAHLIRDLATKMRTIAVAYSIATMAEYGKGLASEFPMIESCFDSILEKSNALMSDDLVMSRDIDYYRDDILKLSDRILELL